MALPPIGYATFLGDPSRRDVYVYIVTVDDDTGTTQTLYWATKSITTKPTDTPANQTFEGRVVEGGYDYESPSFDPNEPGYGVLASIAPQPLVVHQIEGDLDAKMDWRWAGATITVKHGGWTNSGQVAYADFGTIATAEVDGWPRFDQGSVSFPLRSYESRFDALVERRTLAGLYWCIEGDGSTNNIDFNPFAPGVRMRAVEDGNVSSGSGTSLVMNRPGDVVSGDLMVAVLTSHSNGGSPYVDWSVSSPPAGWTLITSTSVLSGGVAAHRIYAYYKVAGGSEATSYTWTGTGTSCNRNWSLSVWYGQDGSTPIVTSAVGSGGPGTTATAPTVTTTKAKDILLSCFGGARVFDGETPTGMTVVSNRYKNTTGGNGSGMKVCSEVRAVAGATGTRTTTWGGASGRWVAISLVIGNRTAGGQPTKLDLRNSMTAHIAFVPLAIGGVQHLAGWEQKPFRAYLDASGHFVWAWVKSSILVTKTTAFTFVAERRYHVDVVHTDTSVKFRIYDYLNDTLTEETFAGTGFNTRDAPGASEHFTMLFNYNGGSGTNYYDGQIWTWRVWNVAKDDDFLDAQRMRPLDDEERLDSSLIHYVEFVEKTGTICGDLSLNPADGTIGKGEWRPTLTGEADQIGQFVPCVFGGLTKNWPGVMVESSVDGAFFLVHGAKIQEFLQLKEGGAVRDEEIEHDDYRSFLSTVPSIGKYSVYRGDVGSFYRCATVPVLPSTCDLYGDAYNGTYVWTAADIVDRVLTTRGEEPVTTNSASKSTLNTAAPWAVDGAVGNGETIEDYARRILGTAGAVVYPKRNGIFYYKQWTIPPSSESPVQSVHRKNYVRDTLEVLDVKLPVRKVKASYRRNWLVMTRDQISGELTEDENANDIRFLLKQWRYASFRRWIVANRYPRSRDLDIEAYFGHPWLAWQHAGTLATSILDLYGTPGQMVEFKMRRTTTPIELFDVVEFNVQDLDDTNVLRDRLNTTSTTLWRVVYVRDERMNGSETVRLWRPDSTVTT